MWNRLQPAISLFLLAPLIAEYLLGSLSFGQLWLFPIMALMYGAGALLVREAARGSGRGWPTIFTLGLAYAFVEEGLTTQSLFNPHYLGLRLLDYGYIPQLGIGAPWTVYVLIIHVVWSIAVPIGFVEWLYPAQRTTPWLGKTGLVISFLIYLLGVALVIFGTHQQEKFTATTAQLAATATISALLIAAAFWFFPAAPAPPNDATMATRGSSAKLGLLSFVAGSVFQLVTQLGSAYFAPGVAVAILVAISLAMIAVALAAKRSGLGTAALADPLMMGALLAYCWLGFFMTVRLHGPSSLPGQFFPFTVVVAIIAWRLNWRPPVSSR